MYVIRAANGNIYPVDRSVFRIADKVILIDKQTITWTGTPKDMFNSANKKIQEFIKPINYELFFK